MANIELIKQLNAKYKKESPIRHETKLFALNEAMDPSRLEKGLTDSLASMGPNFTAYFDLGLPADVALLFIDVCSFSTRFGHLDGEEIAKYFDKYYDIVIPIIYKHGGEVDKIIGDGVICVFGPPFLENALTSNIEKASNCCKAIIAATEGTDYSSKIALHCGTINYFKNKTGLYKEFTLIGKPLTELFRLESVSMDERINYYDDTKVRKFYEKSIAASIPSIAAGGKAHWLHEGHILPDLKGVSFSAFYSLRHNK